MYFDIPINGSAGMPKGDREELKMGELPPIDARSRVTHITDGTNVIVSREGFSVNLDSGDVFNEFFEELVGAVRD